MNNYTVYCHISPSGKRYVGITSTSLDKRWSRGNGYKKNFHFWRAIQLYGWDAFAHEVIAKNLTYEQASEMEAQLIEDWDLTNPQNGYNLSKGEGRGVSEETHRRMSESQKGNKNSVGRKLSEDEKRRISETLKSYYAVHPGTFTGRTHTEETLQKLRERTMSEEAKMKMMANRPDHKGSKNPSARAVIRISPLDGLTKYYAYATLAAQELNADLSSIIKCCRGKNKTVAGYMWRYADDEHCCDVA